MEDVAHGSPISKARAVFIDAGMSEDRATHLIEELLNANLVVREGRGQRAGRALPPTFTTGSIGDAACMIVYNYVWDHLDKSDDRHATFALDEVYVVWQTKVLQNWKALVSTTLPDGMYYEVTCNGDRGEVYLDAYKKFENVAYRIGEH